MHFRVLVIWLVKIYLVGFFMISHSSDVSLETNQVLNIPSPSHVSNIFLYKNSCCNISIFVWKIGTIIYIYFTLEREREIKSQQDKSDLVLQVYHHRHSTVSLHSQIIAYMYIKVNKTIKRLNVHVYEMSYLLTHC